MVDFLKSFTSECSPLARSFTYVNNSRGPKIVPCGTLEVTVEALDALFHK